MSLLNKYRSLSACHPSESCGDHGSTCDAHVRGTDRPAGRHGDVTVTTPIRDLVDQLTVIPVEQTRSGASRAGPVSGIASMAHGASKDLFLNTTALARGA